MTKEPSKAILNRSRFKNSNLNLLSCKNVLVFKRQKNISNFPTKKGKKVYFSKITSFGVRQIRTSRIPSNPFSHPKVLSIMKIIPLTLYTYVSLHIYHFFKICEKFIYEQIQCFVDHCFIRIYICLQKWL